jgi:hypothetical protein
MATEECVIDESAINYARMLIERGGGMAAGSQHLGVYVAPDESFVDKCPCAWVFFPLAEVKRDAQSPHDVVVLLAECIVHVRGGRKESGLPDAIVKKQKGCK